MEQSGKRNIKTKGNIHKKNISKKRKKRKISWLQIIVAIGVIAALILLSIKPDFSEKSQRKFNRPSEPKFKKEGELTFYKQENKEAVITIDIEIAEDTYDRVQGLMFRRSMPENIGMLFIMEREEPQAFWMKNTYISLDIIYLDKDLQIVKIQKYTQPLSEESVPSYKKSKYVVEVIAGFCDRHLIKEGDFIRYQRKPDLNT